jgi:hypothetical protein
MSTSLQYLVHFIQHKVLEIISYNTRVHSVIIKQQKLNKHLAENDIRIRLCPPEEFSTQELLLKLHLQRDKINPDYTMYSQDLPS